MNRPRIALVTGATGGLGEAVCRRFLAEGLGVVLVGHDEVRTSALRERLGARERVAAETCELTSAEDVARLAARVKSTGWAPDILVNSAAIQGPIGPFLQSGWAEWARTIAIDLLAPIQLTQTFVPRMAERGWGRVINVSGGGGTGPRPDFSAYAVAKTGLIRFTETLAHELAGTAVTVNAVAPGPMNTRMLQEVLAAGRSQVSREYDAAVSRSQAGGVPPEQAAALVAWLASDVASGITGRLLSAVWDPWTSLAERATELAGTDIYTLRRIVPKDRGKEWG